MKSNIFAQGPLRPKPPSEEIIQVSPAPHDYSYDKDEPPLQYGVGNPHWYSNEIQVARLKTGRKLNVFLTFSVFRPQLLVMVPMILSWRRSILTKTFSTNFFPPSL